MRSVGLLLWLGLAAALLLPLLRPVPASGRRRVLDELVKDPVCQTYVLRSRALARGGPADPIYFCSADCARRYAGPISR
jgi:YHS domain-containing protein